MSTNLTNGPTTEQTTRRGVYRAQDVNPLGIGIDECEHPDCDEVDGLQFVDRLGGDARVYCPACRDTEWRIKIR